MKKLAAMILISVMLTACSTVRVNIIEYPAHKTTDQRKIDNLECNRNSRVLGPLLFGIGPIIYRNMAKNRYCNCMEARGYVVER